jgi:hypothetical protein
MATHKVIKGKLTRMSDRIKGMRAHRFRRCQFQKDPLGQWQSGIAKLMEPGETDVEFVVDLNGRLLTELWNVTFPDDQIIVIHDSGA